MQNAHTTTTATRTKNNTAQTIGHKNASEPKLEKKEEAKKSWPASEREINMNMVYVCVCETRRSKQGRYSNNAPNKSKRKYTIQKCVAILATSDDVYIYRCSTLMHPLLHMHSNALRLWIFSVRHWMSMVFGVFFCAGVNWVSNFYISFVFVYSATAANLLFGICFAISSVAAFYFFWSNNDEMHREKKSCHTLMRMHSFACCKTGPCWCSHQLCGAFWLHIFSLLSFRALILLIVAEFSRFCLNILWWCRASRKQIGSVSIERICKMEIHCCIGW